MFLQQSNPTKKTYNKYMHNNFKLPYKRIYTV